MGNLPPPADFTVILAVSGLLVYPEARERFRAMGAGPDIFCDWPAARFLVARAMQGGDPFDQWGEEIARERWAAPGAEHGDERALSLAEVCQAPDTAEDAAMYVEAAVRFLAARWLPARLRDMAARVESGKYSPAQVANQMNKW